MSLAVNTQKGRESLRHEEEQLDIIKQNYGDVRFVHTPKDRESDVDGFVVDSSSTAVAMFLSSCRDATRYDMEQWDDEWLLTYDKLQKAVGLAKQLCMPVAGYLYLVPDKVVLVTRLINDRGEILPEMRLERTITKDTCNGGKALRTNAYIKLTGAKELRNGF